MIRRSRAAVVLNGSIAEREVSARPYLLVKVRKVGAVTHIRVGYNRTLKSPFLAKYVG